jgi:hypothetical protein
LEEAIPEVQNWDEIYERDEDVEEVLQVRLVVRDANEYTAQWVGYEQTADKLKLFCQHKATGNAG